MFADLRALSSDAPIETDICIAGAGAAGIAIALALVDSRVNVCLLESGGLDHELEAQALYAGENAGRDYYPLEMCRLRFFGGTTNHWGGRSRPLSDWDFAARAWVPYSGWPIGLADLESHYRRAQEICGLGPFMYDAEVWKQLNLDVPPIDPKHLRYAFWQYSISRRTDSDKTEPVRFGSAYRDALSRAENIRVLLHANVTGIRLDPTGRTVQGFEIRSLTGMKCQVRARQYVLACGAIENARILLLSNDVMPEGVGNGHDLVGRFFMEHPDSKCGIVEASGSVMRTFGSHRLAGREFKPGVLLAPDVQAQESVLGCVAAFAKVKQREPGNLESAFSEVLAYFHSLAPDTRNERPKSPLQFNIAAKLEQAPNPESRVTLADKYDVLGLRQARLTWRLTEQDKRSLLTLTKIIGLEFGRLNLGRVRIADWLLDGTEDWGGEMHGS